MRKYNIVGWNQVAKWGLFNSTLTGTALSLAHFGQGTGEIWLDEVSCTGSESELLDCRHDDIGVHDCDHSEDASVRCSSKLIIKRLLAAFITRTRTYLFLKLSYTCIILYIIMIIHVNMNAHVVQNPVHKCDWVVTDKKIIADNTSIYWVIL